jgi:hypothetical protein
MTPRQLGIYVRQHEERIEVEREQKQHEIYATAMLVARFTWAKGKLPSYEKVFNQEKKRKVMTNEDMLRVVERLNRQFGGTDERGSG